MLGHLHQKSGQADDKAHPFTITVHPIQSIT